VTLPENLSKSPYIPLLLICLTVENALCKYEVTNSLAAKTEDCHAYIGFAEPSLWNHRGDELSC
jgi:hypothetical protein